MWKHDEADISSYFACEFKEQTMHSTFCVVQRGYAD